MRGFLKRMVQRVRPEKLSAQLPVSSNAEELDHPTMDPIVEHDCSLFATAVPELRRKQGHEFLRNVPIEKPEKPGRQKRRPLKRGDPTIIAIKRNRPELNRWFRTFALWDEGDKIFCHAGEGCEVFWRLKTDVHPEQSRLLQA